MGFFWFVSRVGPGSRVVWGSVRVPGGSRTGLGLRVLRVPGPGSPGSTPGLVFLGVGPSVADCCASTAALNSLIPTVDRQNINNNISQGVGLSIVALARLRIIVFGLLKPILLLERGLR